MLLDERVELFDNGGIMIFSSMVEPVDSLAYKVKSSECDQRCLCGFDEWFLKKRKFENELTKGTVNLRHIKIVAEQFEESVTGWELKVEVKDLKNLLFHAVQLLRSETVLHVSVCGGNANVLSRWKSNIFKF